ncbi:MAG: chloride channel protein [Bacteroidales bacterium]|nr:chloride channel protein [Bacteroidales bacterium]
MQKNNIHKTIYRWRLRHMSEQGVLLLLSVVVGLLAGLAAVGLKTLVGWSGRLVTSAFADGSSLVVGLLPMLGILLTMLFVKYIVRGDIGHGLPTVLLAISRAHSRLPAKNMYTSLIASTLTVAFGGSVGLEAPIASTGSAIGSNIGRFFHLNPKSVRLLLGCGAAGAIAGIFKAPIAGILFVFEVFLFDLTSTTVLPLLIASLSASMVSYFLMGTGVQFSFTVQESFALSQLPHYAVLGVFCAAVSLYFLRVTDRVEGWFNRRANPWLRMLFGGVALGVLVVVFPPLYGEGYHSLTELLHGNPGALFDGAPYENLAASPWALVAVLLALVMLKAVATAATIGAGGVGGTFGPSLVIGGLCGYLMATLNNLLGLPPQSTANFALVGMAAVMTGVMHAPFMATFLIAEITGGYALLVPLLTAASITYLCITPFERHSIYARKLAKHGDLLTHDKDASAWHLLNMKSLIENNFVIVRSGNSLRDLVEVIQTSRRNIFPVLTDDDKFLGVVVLDDVRKIIFRPELYDSVTVDELMHPLSEGDVVRATDSLTDVVQKFRISERYNLVVIDDNYNYMGFLSRANTFSAYRRFVSEASDE